MVNAVGNLLIENMQQNSVTQPATLSYSSAHFPLMFHSQLFQPCICVLHFSFLHFSTFTYCIYLHFPASHFPPLLFCATNFSIAFLVAHFSVPFVFIYKNDEKTIRLL